MENKDLIIKDCIGIHVPVTYCITPYLRYAKKVIPIDNVLERTEFALQQMWQGSDGSQKWEWIELFEESNNTDTIHN